MPPLAKDPGASVCAADEYARGSVHLAEGGAGGANRRRGQMQTSSVTMHRVMCPLMIFVKPGSSIGRIEVNRMKADGNDRASRLGLA